MSRNVPGLILAYLAAAAIGARLIVKHGAADGAVLQGAAGTDPLIGVSTDIAASTGETCDVIRSDVAPVVYGGTVTRGDPLTSDANGRAIAAVPGVGATLRIVGFAEVSGVVGDIGSVFIAPAIIRGPAS